ncbi:MAG: MFS transporter [Myxococcales bacterium]|nr:MFS transporter [Myxococcales bacterium]
MISLFWSVMADLFSGADARRLFGLIATGGTIGALLGPGLGGALALTVGPAYLPMVVALLLEIAAVCMHGVGTHASPASTEPDPDATPVGGHPLAAVADLLRSPTLLRLCAYVLVLTTTSTLLYLIQARIVADATSDDQSRTVLFASVDLAINVLTLLIQALLTGRLLRRVGVGWALATVPILCLLGFAAVAALPILPVLIGAQILRRSCDYAIARPAREVVYTGVDRSQRYKAKSFIDTVVYRGGDALTGWLFAGLKGLGLGLAAIAALGLPLAALGLGVARSLGATTTETHAHRNRPPGGPLRAHEVFRPTRPRPPRGGLEAREAGRCGQQQSDRGGI